MTSLPQTGIIEIKSDRINVSNTIAMLVRSFLQGRTVRIDGRTLADYCPYEGLRFAGDDVVFIAACDGSITDHFNSAQDLMEWHLGRELDRRVISGEPTPSCIPF